MSDAELVVRCDLWCIDPATIPSAALRRLIAEIQHEMIETTDNDPGNPVLGIQAYNRIHNRHNRSIDSPQTYNRTHNRHNRGR